MELSHSAHHFRWPSVATLVVLLSHTAIFVAAYRKADVDTPPVEPAAFAAYDPGFVGRVDDPNVARRYRVNPGAPGLSQAQPNIFRGVLPRQNCQSMVGPIGNVYYCTSVQAGYCDRRSGACFCHDGYMGKDCSRCRPTHYNSGNGTCLPRKLCPNDCSGAGDCDANTGRCHCVAGRRGVDCSLQHCRLLGRWCQSCSDSTCTACAQGRFLDPRSGECAPCSLHDPRCLDCDSSGCITCVDPLLRSIRRSGRRRQDAPPPADEDARELARQVPFGSQSEHAFDEAEPFVPITEGDSYAAMGIIRPPFTFADACRGVLDLTRRTDAVGGHTGQHVTLAMLASDDMLTGVARTYRIDCSYLMYLDSWYGFGPSGAGLEGPVEGAVHGSSLSPMVYGPGAVMADGGLSITDVDGGSIVYNRVVNDTVTELLVGLEAALANSTTPEAVRFKRWNDLTTAIRPLVSGRDINTTLYGAYAGYRIQSVVGLLNTNDTARNFSWTYALPSQQIMRRQLQHIREAMELLQPGWEHGQRRLFQSSSRSLPRLSPQPNISIAVALDLGFTPFLPLLNATAMACERSWQGDRAWQCVPIRQSHTVCGAPGTVSFSSPQYAVLESAGHVPITIKRTGGGVGRVTITISLQHITTGPEDVSLSGSGGFSETLVFEPGVVALTIHVPVYDDRVVEPAGWPSQYSSLAPSSSALPPSRLASLASGRLTAGPGAGASAAVAPWLLPAEFAALASTAGGIVPGATSEGFGVLHGLWGNKSLSGLTEGELLAATLASGQSLAHFYNATFSSHSGDVTSWPHTGGNDWHARLGPHETFGLILGQVTGGATLGSRSQAWVAVVDDDGLNLNHAATVPTGALLTPVPEAVLQAAAVAGSGASILLDPVLAAESEGQLAPVYATAGRVSSVVIQPTDARGVGITAARLQAHSLQSSAAYDVSVASVPGQEVFIVTVEGIPSSVMQQALVAVGNVGVSADEAIRDAQGTGTPVLGLAVAPVSEDDENDGSNSAVDENTFDGLRLQRLEEQLLHMPYGQVPYYEAQSERRVDAGNVNGNYTVPVRSTVAGLVRTSLLHAVQGGLLAEYWDNEGFRGVPRLARVEQSIERDWGSGSILDLGAEVLTDHVSIRWSGRIRADPGAAGWHNLTLRTFDRARVSIDGEVVLDLWAGQLPRFEPRRSQDVRPSSLKLLANTSAPSAVCTYGRAAGSSSSSPGAGSSTIYPDVDVYCVQADIESALLGTTDEGFLLSKRRDRVWGSADQQRPDFQSYTVDSLRSFALGSARAAVLPVWLSDNHTHAITVEYVHGSGPALIFLSWRSQLFPTAAPAVPIPARALFHTHHLGGSPRLSFLHADRPWAHGPLVTINTPAVGNSRSIQTVLASSWGTGGAVFAPFSQLGSGTQASDAGITLPMATSVLGAGTATAMAGQENTIALAIRDSFGNDAGHAARAHTGQSLVHVQGTLLRPQVDIAVTPTPASATCGPWGGVHAGARLDVTLKLAPRVVVPNVQAAWISGVTRTVVPGRLRYNQSAGLVAAVLHPTVAGIYALSTVVYVDWDTYRHASGSPGILAVLPGAMAPVASTVTGPGVQADAGLIPVGSPHVAVVIPRDINGNVIVVDEDVWCPSQACLSGQSGVYPALWTIPSLGQSGLDGSRLDAYRIRVQPMHVTDNGAAAPVVLTALALPVEDVTAGPASAAWNGSYIEVGHGVKVDIQAGLMPAVYQSVPTGIAANPRARALVYAAVWIPTVAGEYRVSVSMSRSGAPLADSPYPVLVPAGPINGTASTIEDKPDHTFLPVPTAHAFTVIARDSFGNVRTVNNRTWTVLTPNLAVSLDGSTAQVVDATVPVGGMRKRNATALFPSAYFNAADDRIQAYVNWTVFTAHGPVHGSRMCTRAAWGAARYNVTCDCRGLTCELTVLAGGVKTGDSPHVYYRPAHAADPTTSNAYGPGLSVLSAGRASSVFVQARDSDGNVLAGAQAAGQSASPWSYPALPVSDAAAVCANLTRAASITITRLGGVQPDAVEATEQWPGYVGINHTWSTMQAPFKGISWSDLSSSSFSLLPRLQDENILARLVDQFNTAKASIHALPPVSVPLWPFSPMMQQGRVPANWTYHPSLAPVPGTGIGPIRVNLGVGKGSDGTPMDQSWTVTIADSDDAWAQAWPPSSTYSPAAAQAVPQSTLSTVCLPVPDSPGLLQLQYTIPRSGLYRVNLTLPVPGAPSTRREALGQLPLVAAALPGPSSISQTDVSGPATLGAVSGVPTGLAIVPRDAMGNRVARDGAEAELWAVEVEEGSQGSRSLPILQPIADVPGIFTARWVPVASGSTRVSVVRAQGPGQVQAEYWTGLAQGTTWSTADTSRWALSTSKAAPLSTVQPMIGFDLDVRREAGSTGVDSVLYGSPGWRVKYSAFLRIPKVMPGQQFAVPLSGRAPANGSSFTADSAVSAPPPVQEELSIRVTAIGGSAEVWLAGSQQSLYRITPGTAQHAFTGRLNRVGRIPTGQTRTFTATVTLDAFHALVVTYAHERSMAQAGLGERVMKDNGQVGEAATLRVEIASSAVQAATNSSILDHVPISPAFLFHPSPVHAPSSPYTLTVSPGPANATASTVQFLPQAGVAQAPLAAAASDAYSPSVFIAPAVAGHPLTAVVTIRDTAGNARPVGPIYAGLQDIRMDNLFVWAVRESDSALVGPSEFNISYSGSAAAYLVTFTPSIASLYRLHVVLNPPAGLLRVGVGAETLLQTAQAADLLITPGGLQTGWRIAVIPSIITADLLLNSVAVGKAVSEVTSGVPGRFHVLLRDVDGNAVSRDEDVTVEVRWSSILDGQTGPRDEPWDPVLAVPRIPGVDPVPLPAVTELPGRPTAFVHKVAGSAGNYSVSYVAQVAGTYMIRVRVNGQQTAESPYTLRVLPAAASALASSIELPASVPVSTSPVDRVLYNTDLFAYGRIRGSALLNGLPLVYVGLTPSQALDSMGILPQDALAVAGSAQFYRVEGTGSIVPVPAAPLPEAALAVVPTAATAVAARDRPLILVSLSSAINSTAVHPSLSRLVSDMGLSNDPALPLVRVAQLQAVASMHPGRPLDAAAMLYSLHAPVLGSIQQVLVRLREASGAPLPAIANNVLYVALVRERVSGSMGSPTWSPWGPAEAPVSGSRGYSATAPWVPVGKPHDAVGAAGAQGSTVSIRGTATGTPSSTALRVSVFIPSPAVLYRLTNQSLPVAPSSGAVTAPVTLPADLAAMTEDALLARVSVLGAWRLHVLLLQPASSTAVVPADDDYGITARFWPARDDWVAGHGAAFATRLAGAQAVSFGFPGAASPTALWMRSDFVPYTLVVMTGFLVPPITGAYTLRVRCDGPCSVEVDGVQRLGWNSTHATAGLREGSDVEDGSVTVVMATMARLPMRQKQGYAVRMTLERTALASTTPSAGALQLTWRWESSDHVQGDQEVLDRAIPRASAGFEPVPAQALFWAGQHVLGSPTPVCVGSCNGGL